MSSIQLTLPDGSVREVAAGTTALEVAKSIGARLTQAAVAAVVEGKVVDLNRPIERDAQFRLLTFRDPEGQQVYHHSTAHVMAQAVQRLWPDAKVTIGPPIDGGFYYDFEVAKPFTPDDFAPIEAEMLKIIAEDQPFVRSEVSRDKARALFESMGELYKLELLDAIPEGEAVSLYDNLDAQTRERKWVDLCRGPHVPSTGCLKAVKLLRVAGAYWRGDERNKMLSRIYGTSFDDKKKLDEHLANLAEAERRDHRRLGRELDLFAFDPIAPASPFFFPKGAIIYNQLIDYVRTLYVKYGYDEVITPQISDAKLWHTSGHYEKFKDNMFFFDFDEREFGVKPMNCPGHALMYAMRHHSYRELPVRYADFGRLHRAERTGVTQGLTRVWTFAQDDAHIFCRADQIEQEIFAFIEMLIDTYTMFGFPGIEITLSTRPAVRLGDDAVWDHAERALNAVLKGRSVDFKLDGGGGAFYGPKIDFFVRDALKRPFQLGTVQLDFMMPERFGLEYVDRDNATQRPVMIHRAMLGSLERFMGILLEHSAGAFPVWLAPVQIAILPIADRHNDYCFNLANEFKSKGLRVEVDTDSAKTGAKVAKAETQKIPYMLVIGDREVTDGTVSVRARGRRTIGAMRVEEFSERVVGEVQTRRDSE